MRTLIFPPKNGRDTGGHPDFAAAPNATCTDGDGVVTIDSLHGKAGELPWCRVNSFCSFYVQMYKIAELTAHTGRLDVPARWNMQRGQNGYSVNVTGILNLRHGQAVSDEHAQRVTVAALLASAGP